MPPGERVRLRSTSYQASGMPASGTMSCSRAAVIEEWTRASPSHISSTLEDRVGFTAPMVDGARRVRTPSVDQPQACASSAALTTISASISSLMVWLAMGMAPARPSQLRPKSIRLSCPLALMPSRSFPPPIGSGTRPLERGVQHDRLGRGLDGEVAVDLEGLAVDRLDAVELEGDLGVLLGLEEVGRAEVVVTHLRPGVDAGDVDRHLAVDLGDVVLRPFEVALERVELPAHG